MKDWDFQILKNRGLLEQIIVDSELTDAIKSGKKISIYQGFDPTSPRLHLGHMISLRVLRWFQLHGHRVIFLIGDFTGRVGDPTDKSATRQQMTHEEVLENAKTYKDQASKILDFEGENPVEVKFNSEWLDKLTFSDVVELSANVTVQQMIQRDMFQKRLEENKPISLHEFLYPLMQGYDSVAMEVDAELGGRDQMFNMMVGRDLASALLNKPKHVLMTPLLPGLDGKKMGKTEGNTVDLLERPTAMYFKLTQVQDQLLPQYLSLLTDVDDSVIADVRERLKTEANLQDARQVFASEVVRTLHDEAAVQKAEAEFARVIDSGELPQDVPTVEVSRSAFPDGDCGLVDVIALTGLVKSRSDARRVIEQGGARLDGEQNRDVHARLPIEELADTILRVGKRGDVRLRVTD